MKPKDGGRVIRREGSLLPERKFNIQEMANLLLEHAIGGGGIYSFPAWLIHSQKWSPKLVPHVETLKYWMRHYPEFKEVVDLVRDIALGSEIYLLDGAKLGQVKNYDYRAHKLKMMNLFGWKDKVEHSGEIATGGDRREEMLRILKDPETNALARQLAKRMAAQAVGDTPPQEEQKPKEKEVK